MRKRIIGGIATVGIVASAGVAWALITGIFNVPNIAQGLAQGGGASSCQAGNAVVFDLPEPTWNNTLGTYAVSSVAYSNITQACVDLETADLIVNITTGNQTQSIANGSAQNMTSRDGTILLSTPVDFDVMTTAKINFLVRND